MNQEREAQAAIFQDSWDRLAWVEDLVERVRVLAKSWLLLPKLAHLDPVLHEASTREGHLEFSVGVARHQELPPPINFLIGNIVTDARSCLDMAIDAIWKHYQLEEKGVQVQFPLEDNFAEKRSNKSKGQALQKFLDQLDDRFVEVIERAQPNYASGLIDIPSNLSAIVISKLSNANKHRNITPVKLRTVLSSYGSSTSGVSLSALNADHRRGLPPIRFAIDYDTQVHSGQAVREMISALEDNLPAQIHINMAQLLEINGQEIPIFPPRLNSVEVEMRAQLDDLLSKVPAYVRLTLRNLNRVHTIIEEGNNEFYMLDTNGTL